MSSVSEIRLKTAISFQHEHGIFLKNRTMRKLKLKKGDALGIEHGELVEFEVCRKFNEVNVRTEATALMALFEAITSDYYVFLSEHGLTEKLAWKSSPFPFTLGEICPELHVKRDSLFTFIYKRIEDVLIQLDLSPEREIPEAIQGKIEESRNFIESLLIDFYDSADCVLGIGSFLSFVTRKPLELCFGICGLPVGRHVSKLSNEGLLVNPYLLYWALSDCGNVKRGKVNWTHPIISIQGKPEWEIPIDALNMKIYLPSIELTPWGASTTWLNRYIHQSLMQEKPYILEHDLLLPFTCPSIVMELNHTTEISSFAATPYGRVITRIEVPKVTENTKINIEFFDYPLYNKQHPVVLDTSAVDVARFPLQPTDPFFDVFLEGREIIIPTVVLYELRTRFSTQDKRRVSEALARINCLKSWGFIKDLRYEESLPLEMIRIVKSKKKIEDLADFMVLATAIKNKGILFTNDKELGEFAFLNGVHVISYTSLEDDVIRIIIEHSGKYSIEDVIKVVQDYGLKIRGHKYDEADIREVINLGIKRREIQEINGKLVYTGPKRRTIKPRR